MNREVVFRRCRRWALPPIFLCFLLLPVLFQTVLGFQSYFRGNWELLYFVLAVGMTLFLWSGDWEKRGGTWGAAAALAAGTGALFCQNGALSAALGLLAIVLCAGARPHWAIKGLTWAALALLSLLLGLRLLSATLGAAVGYYEVSVPDQGPRYSAVVTITDPGAMGRVRYHATEQWELFSLGRLARVSVVTGRDSAPSGQEKYGYLVDAYFGGM